MCRSPDYYLSSDKKCYCKSGLYISENSECKPCPEFCLACEIKYFNDSSMLQCLHCCRGYVKNDGKCIPKYFELYLKLHSNNEIELLFNEILDYILSDSDISINTTIKNFKFKLSQKSNASYAIYLIFEESVTEGTPFTLYLLNKTIFSINNSILLNYEYSGNFYELDFISETMKIIIEKAESASSTMNIASISLALISNPSAAWVLLNTILIIYFLPLSYQVLTPGIIKICKAMSNLQGNINVPKMILDSQSSRNILKNARKIGIHSSNIFINLGSDITLLIGIMLI